MGGGRGEESEGRMGVRMQLMLDWTVPGLVLVAGMDKARFSFYFCLLFIISLSSFFFRNNHNLKLSG